MPTSDESIRERYLPDQKRSGIALCLSGGGFRATLFHLGATRRLHELGVFAQVDTVTSVSGGSIFSAFLAHALKLRERLEDYDVQIARPVRDFVSTEMRTWAAVKSHAIPINWFRPNVGTDSLARSYRDGITSMALRELPSQPRFVFCATDMVFLVNWVFERERVGDYQVGYMPPTDRWTVARAVAASSCFPPVFRAMRLALRAGEMKGGTYRGPNRDELVAAVALSDGGVYDNMGLEPVWKDHAVVLVSDGGGDCAFEAPWLPHKQILRYTDVARDQALALRRRWLITNFLNPPTKPEMEGTYWSVKTEVGGYSEDGIAPPGYPPAITAMIAGIRTDLDAFSEAEQKVLENHGYALAGAAVGRYCRNLKTSDAPFSPPHVEYWGEQSHARIAKELASSHKRRWLGRR